MPPSITTAELLACRLANQAISDSRFTRPAEVVRWLGAVQAQDYLGGLWAIGLRTDKATESDVERALANRSIVRTWPMRGTLHFVAAADARWMLDLCAARILQRNEKRLRSDFEITAPVLAAARKVIVKALEGGKTLTRDALYKLLDDAGIETGDSRGLHIVFALAHVGFLCFGCREGKQQTFALLDEWLPAQAALPRDEALAMLARRYFTSHGPATIRDFAWWSGLTLADAKRAIEITQPLDRLERDDQELWWVERDIPPLTSRSFLLPAWDEYTVGYSDREPLVDPSHRKKLDRYGVMNQVMVRRGQVFGAWKRAVTPHQVRVKASPFVKQTKPQRESIASAARRYGHFLGLPAVVVR
ncbi:MAG TPA: winged helix DNA-binding domain-containing protein [Gemmatimonadales bacterium]